MEITPLALVAIALLLAAWTIAAAVLVIRSNAKTKRTKALQTSIKRMQHMIDAAPAIPLLVRVDGRIDPRGVVTLEALPVAEIAAAGATLNPSLRAAP